MFPKDIRYQAYYLIEAFESGIKDVVELKHIEPYEELINYLKSKRYFRKLVKRKNGKSSYYFFKTKELKQEFLDNILQYVRANDIYKIAERYGLMMGYPPKACEVFVGETKNKDLVRNILVNYNGMYFASFEQSIEEDFKWLFKNKPLGPDSFILIENTYCYCTNDSNYKEVLLRDLDFYKTTVLENKLKKMKSHLEQEKAKRTNKEQLNERGEI